MFAHTDPTGSNFLASQLALDEYRAIVDGLYRPFAQFPSSAFTFLEAFDALANGAVSQRATVDWTAFPITAGLPNNQIDQQRLTVQDEYVEWETEKDASGKVTKVTFTTEFPEYFQALAQVSLNALIAGIQEVIPGANPTVRELLGTSTDSTTGEDRARKFRGNLRNNPWNNGEKGILCLTQRANTFNALLNLLSQCGIPQPNQNPANVCSLVGDACGAPRNSDPAICLKTQTLATQRQGLSLADPAGVQFLDLKGIWRINGQPIDNINDLANNQGTWQIIRGGRRAVLKVINGLTLNGDSITSGAQVSTVLRVGAEVIAARNADLPVSAQIGQETRGV